MDVRLNEEIPVENISSRLKDNLPADIRILNIESVEEHAPALQTQVLSAVYDIHLTEPVDGAELTRMVEALMMSESAVRERRGKTYDLRPLIEMLSVVTEASGNVWLRMTLAAREGATGRPEEVLNALGIAPEYTRIERTRLVFKN